MTLDFSDMLAALGGDGHDQDPGEAAAQPEGVPEDVPAPHRHGVLDAAALLADVQEHKRRIELAAKAKLKKDKKVERSKGYIDKIGAADKFRKAQTKKSPGGKHKNLK